MNSTYNFLLVSQRSSIDICNGVTSILSMSEYSLTLMPQHRRHYKETYQCLFHNSDGLNMEKARNTLFIETDKFIPLKFIPYFFLQTLLKYHQIIQNTEKTTHLKKIKLFLGNCTSTMVIFMKTNF